MSTSNIKVASDNRQLGKKGRERRRLIVESAKERIISRGLDGLVLREIAEELGITHGNLQYYFQTKDDLLIAIFDDEVQEYTNNMEMHLANASSAEGKLSAIIDSSIEVIEKNETRLWRVMFGIAQQFPDLAQILKRENEFYEEAVAKQLKEIAPTLSPVRRRHISKIIRAVIDGIAIELIYEDPKSPKFAGLKNELKVAFSTILNIR